MRTLLIAGLVAAGAVAQDKVDFTTQVLPILEKNCQTCHKAAWVDGRGVRQNPEGGLRLDGRSWIEKGGDNGPVVTAGKPDQSPLFTRTALPADDPDRMPAEGDPLSKAQIELLKRWIQEGASFAAWTGAAGEAPAVAPASQPSLAVVPPDLAKGLTRLSPEAVAKAAGRKALVTPLSAESPLLRVEFPSDQDQVQDADLQALEPLREHIAQLVLARTRITDAGLVAVAKLPRLVQLDLRETAVGDAGMAHLAKAPRLQVLNLFATKVTDAAVDSLAGIKELRTVHLWQTAVTGEGMGRLAVAVPGLRVVGAPALPEGEAPQRTGRGRRR
jgi:hypothetical protein